MMRIKVIKPFLVTGIIFCSLFSIAQNDDLDKKYMPNESSVFNNLLKKNDPKYGTEIEINSSIKFYPTMTIRQKIFLSYDVNLGSGFCLGLGIGKAFGTDFIQSLFIDLSQFKNNYYVSPSVLASNSKYSGSLPLLSLGTKIYFSGKTFDGGYIEFLYRHERMNYLLNPNIDGYRVDGANNLSFKMNAAFFGFGYTGISGRNNNFTHDIYINIGIKSFKYTNYESSVIPSVNTNVEKIYHQTGTESSFRILPAVNIGYAFGFGF